MYPDWYKGIPLQIWFEPKADRALIGVFYGWKYAPLVFAWGGKVFDLLVIPAMLWKRTRWFAIGLGLVFHLVNSITFEIGTFPYMMIVSTVLFFPPERIRASFLKKKPLFTSTTDAESKEQLGVKICLIAFFSIQVLLPLRHHLIPGHVIWTEEGHRLSWRMMLRSKSGVASFLIRDANGERISHNVYEHLNRSQYRTMSTHPDMIWQYVQYLKKLYGPDISVHVTDYVRVNNGIRAQLIDPKVDLAKEAWHRFKHHYWITEFPGWAE